MIVFDVKVKFYTQHQISEEVFEEYKEKWQEDASYPEDWEDHKDEIIALWVEDNMDRACDTGYSYGDEEAEVIENTITEE